VNKNVTETGPAIKKVREDILRSDSLRNRSPKKRPTSSKKRRSLKKKKESLKK
jgi:hypothetical protein